MGKGPGRKANREERGNKERKKKGKRGIEEDDRIH